MNYCVESNSTFFVRNVELVRISGSLKGLVAMALNNTLIYLSTLQLERNRWNGKGPSLLVSDWLEPMAEAGFQGVEIWDQHLFFASRSEWEAIRERSFDTDIPIAFLYTQWTADASDKSHRQRDFLMEAAHYFVPHGLKFTLPKGEKEFEKTLRFFADWAADLPREMQCARVFEEASVHSGEIAVFRQKLGSRFRCSLNPFSLGRDAVESLFQEAGSSVTNLEVKGRFRVKHQDLQNTDENYADMVSLARLLNFNGSWTLEGAAGREEGDENINLLFNRAEEDLNFFLAILSRK